MPHCLRAAASDPYFFGFWFVVALALTVVAATFQDYGVTWDEKVQNDYGKMVLNYYLSAFQDRSALTFYDLWAYGGLFDFVAAAANRLLPFGEFETRHFLNALVGLFGIVGCWRLTDALAGRRAAFWAALLLLLVPSWYGQMFNNPKDIPFAAFFVWSLYYMVQIVPHLPRVPLRLSLLLGLMIGLTLGVRVGGLLLFFYLGLLGLAYVLAALASHRDWARFVRECGWGLATVALPVVLAAYPVMLLFWPWAQAAPLENPLLALQRFSHLPFEIQVLFDGDIFLSNDPPWTYLPTMLLIKTPELVLILAAAGCGFGLHAAIEQGRRLPLAVWLGHGLLAFAVVFPVVYVIASGANLFDGIRHFLFLLPLLAAAAGSGADRLMTAASRHDLVRAAQAVLALVVTMHVAVMIRLHPDQYVYYNQLVGGVDGAAERFETDYWANSYAEVVNGLVAELREEYEDFEERTFKIRVCDSPFSAAYYFPDNFVLTTSDLQADFLIAFTRYDCHKSLKGREVYRAERLGALLAVAIDRREIKRGVLARR